MPDVASPVLPRRSPHARSDGGVPEQGAWAALRAVKRAPNRRGTPAAPRLPAPRVGDHGRPRRDLRGPPDASALARVEDRVPPAAAAADRTAVQAGLRS